MKTTGDRIRDFRHKREWTQEQLAERMGLSDDFGHLQISQWECDRRIPSATNLVRLADALGVSTDQILGVGD